MNPAGNAGFAAHDAGSGAQAGEFAAGGYAVCVPAIEEKNGDFFLKTLFPSRKYTKRYKLNVKNE
jgi:hypothetical protein